MSLENSKIFKNYRVKARYLNKFLKEKISKELFNDSSKIIFLNNLSNKNTSSIVNIEKLNMSDSKNIKSLACNNKDCVNEKILNKISKSTNKNKITNINNSNNDSDNNNDNVSKNNKPYEQNLKDSIYYYCNDYSNDKNDGESSQVCFSTKGGLYENNDNSFLTEDDMQNNITFNNHSKTKQNLMRNYIDIDDLKNEIREAYEELDESAKSTIKTDSRHFKEMTDFENKVNFEDQKNCHTRHKPNSEKWMDSVLYNVEQIRRHDPS